MINEVTSEFQSQAIRLKEGDLVGWVGLFQVQYIYICIYEKYHIYIYIIDTIYIISFYGGNLNHMIILGILVIIPFNKICCAFAFLTKQLGGLLKTAAGFRCGKNSQ